MNVVQRIRSAWRAWVKNSRCEWCGNRSGGNEDCPECESLDDFRRSNG
jgi:primosomal protein N'